MVVPVLAFPLGCVILAKSVTLSVLQFAPLKNALHDK
jgi:hypothetical protein